MICISTKAVLERRKRGKKSTTSFFDFFQSIKFFHFKKTRKSLYTRARDNRLHITYNNFARSIARLKEKAHVLRYKVNKCQNHSRTAPLKTQTGTITSQNSESNPRNGCNDCWTDPSLLPFTDGSCGFFSRLCTL